MAERKRDHYLKLLFLFLIFFPVAGWTTQYLPWLGNFGELEWRNGMRFQTYHHLLHGSKPRPYASDDLFLESSLATALFNFGLELEIIGANTRRQHGIDQFKVTGRYVWKDDVAGDPFSLLTGVSFIQSFEPSLHDPSSFHHGRTQGEIFLSIGKEFCTEFYDDLEYEIDWNSRGWVMLAMGSATLQGSPWQKMMIAYEKRFGLKHEVRLFAKGLRGLGHKNLRQDHFDGYGSIRHGSVDIGLRYTYLIEFFGSASIEYTNRVYAHNFPAHASQILIEVLYTFGL